MDKITYKVLNSIIYNILISHILIYKQMIYNKEAFNNRSSHAFYLTETFSLFKVQLTLNKKDIKTLHFNTNYGYD